MNNRRRTALPLLSLVLLAVLPWSAARAGKNARVTVTLPVPQKISLDGIEKVLVTDFSVDREDPTMDLGWEVNLLLRKELKKHTSLLILDLDPVAIPEQSMTDLLDNRAFWQNLARTHDADLILTGAIVFEVSDRSGFYDDTVVDPATGQRVRTTRFVERQGYRFDLDLAFILGATGDVAYENLFTEEMLIQGKTSDRLTVLFHMFDRIRSGVLSVVSAQLRTEERILLGY